MNLMSMVNGLNRMDDTNPFSATAFLLAVKMIDLFNRLFWADSVAIDLNRMSAMVKCSSKATIIRARNELVERGVLVIVRKGKKGTPTTYRMNDLSANGSKYEQYPGTNPVPNPEQYPGTNPVPNPEQYPVPISIQDINNTRQSFEEDDEEEEAFERARARARGILSTSYRRCFGGDATEAELDRMASLAAQMDLVDVCEDAVYHTALASPGNRLAYFTALCSDWQGEYIRTRSDLEEHLMYQSYVKNPHGGDVAEYAQMALEARQKRKRRYTA